MHESLLDPDFEHEPRPKEDPDVWRDRMQDQKNRESEEPPYAHQWDDGGGD